MPAKVASKKRLTKQAALAGQSEASKHLAASLGSSKDAVLVGEDMGDVTQALVPPPSFPVSLGLRWAASDAVCRARTRVLVGSSREGPVRQGRAARGRRLRPPCPQQAWWSFVPGTRTVEVSRSWNDPAGQDGG